MFFLTVRVFLTVRDCMRLRWSRHEDDRIAAALSLGASLKVKNYWLDPKFGFLLPVNPLVRATLEDGSKLVRERAVEALNQLATGRARDMRKQRQQEINSSFQNVIRVYTRAIEHKSSDRRRAAAEVLGALRWRESVEGTEFDVTPLLETRANDPCEFVRVAAVQSLCGLDARTNWWEDKVIAHLPAFLSDSSSGVRRLAVQGLARALKERYCPPLKYGERYPSVGIINQRAASLFAPYVPMLEDKNDIVRAAAMQCVADLVFAFGKSTGLLQISWAGGDVISAIKMHIRDSDLLGAFKTLLETGQCEKRRMGAYCLRVLADSRGVELLISALTTDPLDGSTATLIKSLAVLGGRSAVEPILDVLQRTVNGDVRNAAVTCLATIGDVRAVVPLTRLLCEKDTTDGESFELLVKSLDELGDERAWKPLLDVFVADSRITWIPMQEMTKARLTWQEYQSLKELERDRQEAHAESKRRRAKIQEEQRLETESRELYEQACRSLVMHDVGKIVVAFIGSPSLITYAKLPQEMRTLGVDACTESALIRLAQQLRDAVVTQEKEKQRKLVERQGRPSPTTRGVGGTHP